jgi:hypothetical protein
LGAYFFMPYLQLQHNKRAMIRYTTETATIYQRQIPKERTEKQIENEKNLKRGGGFNGFVSEKTAREVTRRISNLLEIAAKGKRVVSFVTLTLPSVQRHDDNFIKRYLLGDFLQIIQRKYRVKNLIWKAEAQKNGNIHFHIMADSYLPNVARVTSRRQGRINEIWNNICFRYGYLETYKADRLKDYRKGNLTEAQIHWHKAFNFSVPNSTDVHPLKSKTKPESYINKYIAKPEKDRRQIEGRIIGCTDQLKEVENFIENENGTQTGWASYYALQLMAKHHPKEVKAIYIDVENRVFKGYKPPEDIHVIIEKYYYPPHLWDQYAPITHKDQRAQHFKNTAKIIYA